MLRLSIYLKPTASIVLVVTVLLAGAREAKAANISWYYEDDFSTTKVRFDSYGHSIFVTSLFEPPPSGEPYLLYYAQQERLQFSFPAGDTPSWDPPDETPAFLAYTFPLYDVLASVDSGTFEVDVVFSEIYGMTSVVREYQLSTDGVNWTAPIPLVEGHNQSSLLPSDNPCTYIKLTSNCISIDNISVTVSGQGIPEPATVVLLGTGFIGLLNHRWKNRETRN